MQKVLMVLEGESGAESALSMIRAMAREPESAVLLRVSDGPAGPGGEAGLNRFRRSVENGGTIIEKTLLRDGDPAEEILKIAREERVDLIIMSSERKGGLRGIFTGSMTGAAKAVERRAEVPVLVGRTSGNNKSMFDGWRGKNAA